MGYYMKWCLGKYLSVKKIGYINDTGEIETYTVVDYITKYLSKKEIEKNNIIYVKREDTN